MKPGHSTPAPDDVCAKCGFNYNTHTGISRYCPESAHGLDLRLATNSTFAPSPAPGVAATSDNELIAEFMGLLCQRYADGSRLYSHVDEDGDSWSYPPDQLEYNKKWSWLMPVVEKINNTELTTDQYRFLQKHSLEGGIFIRQIFNPIDMVYSSVVEFIKWYNTQTPKS